MRTTEFRVNLNLRKSTNRVRAEGRAGMDVFIDPHR